VLIYLVLRPEGKSQHFRALVGIEVNTSNL